MPPQWEVGPAAYGTTNEQGEFSLKSGNKGGVAPGEYKVAVTKANYRGVKEDETLAPGGVKVEWVIPERFSKTSSSKLKLNVPAESYDIRLSSKKFSSKN